MFFKGFNWISAKIIVAVYFGYYVFFPFLENAFAAENWVIYYSIHRAMFDLTIASVATVPRVIVVGVLIGKKRTIWKNGNSKTIFKEVIKKIVEIYPINFVFWGPVIALGWFLFPQASGYRWFHLVASFIWGIFVTCVIDRDEKKTRNRGSDN